MSSLGAGVDLEQRELNVSTSKVSKRTDFIHVCRSFTQGEPEHMVEATSAVRLINS